MYSIHQLHQLLRADLTRCNSEFERSNCLAIGGAEIRQLASEQSATLSPSETFIASLYGYRTQSQ